MNVHIICSKIIVSSMESPVGQALLNWLNVERVQIEPDAPPLEVLERAALRTILKHLFPSYFHHEKAFLTEVKYLLRKEYRTHLGMDFYL